MFITIEFAIAGIALALLLLTLAIGVFYVKIDRQRREMGKIRERIDHTEESIRKISGFFVALKSAKHAV